MYDIIIENTKLGHLDCMSHFPHARFLGHQQDFFFDYESLLLARFSECVHFVHAVFRLLVIHGVSEY